MFIKWLKGGVFENKENSDVMGFMYFFKIVLGGPGNNQKFKSVELEIQTFFGRNLDKNKMFCRLNELNFKLYWFFYSVWWAKTGKIVQKGTAIKQWGGNKIASCNPSAQVPSKVRNVIKQFLIS